MTLAQAKRQSEIDADITEHDTELQESIEEAQDLIEGFLQATLTETQYQYSLHEWPCTYDGRIMLPKGPIISVMGVSYLDRDGNRQSLGIDSYAVVEGQGGYIIPAWQTSWPVARAFPGSIVVEYTAGYVGAGSPMDASGVPKGIVRALKLTVAHWFENREAILVGTVSKELEMGVKDAIQPYRNYP